MGGWKLICKDDAGTSGTFTFPHGFIFPSGETITVTHSTNVGDGTDRLYIGWKLLWNYVNDTILSIALVDGAGIGVDFFKTLGCTDIPPIGTT